MAAERDVFLYRPINMAEVAAKEAFCLSRHEEFTMTAQDIAMILGAPNWEEFDL